MCFFYKHNVVYSRDCWLFKNIDWWGSEGFVAIKFIEYFKFIREQQNLRKAAKSLYIFLTTSDEVEKYLQSNFSDNCMHHYNVILKLFDPELKRINTKPMIKNRLKTLLRE